MISGSKNSIGYVYILESKDICLPICKIGMTTRTPYERCKEINNSSSGDLIWSVSNFLAVDNCKELESLIHLHLSKFRQKGREIFNINAIDAYNALVFIFDNQTEIKKIEMGINTPPIDNKKHKRKHSFKRIDFEYAELLQLFSSILNVKGQPFGQLNNPFFGISDGKKGVQWNLSINTKTEKIQLGVNLEGSEKTGKWLIAPFILNKPDINKIKSKIIRPESVTLRFSRDAWQGPSRLKIKEKFIGGKEYILSEITNQEWDSILAEALTCLDEERNYRGRKKGQPVTLESDGRTLIKDVSPHLTICSELNIEGDIENNIKSKLSELVPIYKWVKLSCKT